MIIKELKLKNFRQYIDSDIVFSTDPNKNITLVLGDNGTGKTTLAQAFLWCLYGETDFRIKEVLNRKVRDALPPDGVCSVEVVMVAEQGSTEYMIDRRQTFRKKYQKVYEDPSSLSVFKNDKGNQVKLSKNDGYYLVKAMLPKELSRFFFFDGERIRVMSDEIEEGNSHDFKEAVTGLVGLVGVQNAIIHLKSASNYYKSKIDSTGNIKVKQYADLIAQEERNKHDIEKNLDVLRPQLESYKEQEVSLRAAMMAAAPSLKQKKDYDTALVELDGLKKRKNTTISSTLLPFLDKRLESFFTEAVIDQVQPELDSLNEQHTTMIPSLEAPALLYLLKRGRCICGQELTPGQEAFNNVNYLLDYVPPKTLGTMMVEVNQQNKNHKKINEGFFKDFTAFTESIAELDEDIENKQTQIDELYGLLTDTSEGEKAKDKLNRILPQKASIEVSIRNYERQLDSINERIQRYQTEKDKYVNVEHSNMSFIRAKAYADLIWNDLTKKYTVLEDNTRNELENRINELFKSIYEGGMKIAVDKNYNIKVTVDEDGISEDDIEKNTAQSYSIIFAFITTIIDMARDKAKLASTKDDLEKVMFSEAEALPLVMDAALSSFDKTRIAQICDIIPSIANQVVFFIKDTDGEIAEENMRERIGKKWIIEKIDDSKVSSRIVEA